MGSSSFWGSGGSGSVSIQGRFETCPYNFKWIANLCGKSTVAVDVGAGFKPAVA